MTDIERAEPRARRAALLIMSAGVIAGATLISVANRFEPAFRTWVSRDLEARSRMVLAALSVMTAGPALAAAVYCWRVGGRRAAMLRGVAIGLSVASVLLVFFLWRLFISLEAGVR